MDSELSRKVDNRKRRKYRLRNKVRGNAEKPRLSIIKTNQHIHVQLIDDEKGLTLASTSTLAKEIRELEFAGRNKEAAKHLGLKMAKLAKEKNISHAVLDRGAFKYHGVIASFAEGVREGGLTV